ncbi:MAG: hypothetical protein ABSA46_18325 [Thermodesulfovibrionales bacterium]|jgi:uncharacterized Zn finger protein
MSYWDFPRYVSVAEKRAKAAKKLKQLSKKNPNLKPVILQGSAIARTWWGKAWNLNLERYADYHNRIGRGRSYVRHGAVLDLQIDLGEARASVQGSRSSPYSVVINIKTLKKDIWQSILDQCQGMLESLQELINGSFPKTMGEIFMHTDSGMFPSPKEINFSCSCPDWADMCKHVAATLYGIGARLDESPELFFRMRNVEMGDLIEQAISDHKQKLLARASKKSSRIIEEADLSHTFGIELEHDLGTASSVSSEDAAPVFSRNSKKTASSAKSESLAKGPSPRKGSQRANQPLAKKTAPTKKKAGKPEKRKKKVTFLAKKTRPR